MTEGKYKLLPPVPPPTETTGSDCKHVWTPWDLDDYTWKCEACEALHKHVVATLELNGEGGL